MSLVENVLILLPISFLPPVCYAVVEAKVLGFHIGTTKHAICLEAMSKNWVWLMIYGLVTLGISLPSLVLLGWMLRFHPVVLLLLSLICGVPAAYTLWSVRAYVAILAAIVKFHLAHKQRCVHD